MPNTVVSMPYMVVSEPYTGPFDPYTVVSEVYTAPLQGYSGLLAEWDTGDGVAGLPTTPGLRRIRRPRLSNTRR